MATQMCVPITMRALVQRVNRRLAKEEKILKKARGREELACFGDYYVLDYAANEIFDDHVDRLALARELGVLHGWETVAEEE